MNNHPKEFKFEAAGFLSSYAFPLRTIKILTIAIYYLLQLVAPSHVIFASQTREELTNEDQIAVKLYLPQKEFHLGERIDLKVEVSNIGRVSLLVANGVSIASGGASYIEFELTDRKGQISPQARLVSDTFSSNEKTNPTMSFLTHWLLLRPGSSISTNVPLDGTIIEFLANPGEYKLSAHYSSNGLSYSPTYAALGITSDDVKLITTPAWRGKIASNQVVLKILPNK
jgi:hypothetical protein